MCNFSFWNTLCLFRHSDSSYSGYRWHFCSLRLIARPRVDHVMDGLDVSCQMFFLDYLYGEFHHYVPCGPSMMIRKPLKTSGNRPRRFPAGFRIFLLIIFFWKKETNTYVKDSETCRKPAGNLHGRFSEVSRGFRIIHHWRTTRYVSCFLNLGIILDISIW